MYVPIVSNSGIFLPSRTVHILRILIMIYLRHYFLPQVLSFVCSILIKPTCGPISHSIINYTLEIDLTDPK